LNTFVAAPPKPAPTVEKGDTNAINAIKHSMATVEVASGGEAEEEVEADFGPLGLAAGEFALEGLGRSVDRGRR